MRTYLTAKEILKLSDKQLKEYEKALKEYGRGNEEPLKEWFKNNIHE